VNVDDQVIVNESNWHLGAYANQNGGFKDSGFSVNTLSNGWHHVVAAGQGTSTTYYVDGALAGTIPFKSNTEITYLGNYQGGTQEFGVVDELRISKGAARTPGWISTEYNNQSSPSTFYTVGSEMMP
jgi:hypothetical protein